MKSFIVVALLAIACILPAACTTNPTTGQTTIGGVNVPHATASPEAQIVAGANAHTAASTLATVLLKNDKINVAQAKGFSTLLHASSTTLDQANATLVTCRKATGSTQAASPDPCAFGVADLIRLAADGIANVRATLDKK